MEVYGTEEWLPALGQQENGSLTVVSQEVGLAHNCRACSRASDDTKALPELLAVAAEQRTQSSCARRNCEVLNVLL